MYICGHCRLGVWQWADDAIALRLRVWAEPPLAAVCGHVCVGVWLCGSTGKKGDGERERERERKGKKRERMC